MCVEQAQVATAKVALEEEVTSLKASASQMLTLKDNLEMQLTQTKQLLQVRHIFFFW